MSEHRAPGKNFAAVREDTVDHSSRSWKPARQRGLSLSTYEATKKLLVTRARSQSDAAYVSASIDALRVIAPAKSRRENARDLMLLIEGIESSGRLNPPPPSQHLRLVESGSPSNALLEGFPVRLSPRQLDCLRLLADGLLTKDIGRVLELSPTTVTHHLSDVYRRLGARNGHQAVAIARRRKLL